MKQKSMSILFEQFIEALSTLPHTTMRRPSITPLKAFFAQTVGNVPANIPWSMTGGRIDILARQPELSWAFELDWGHPRAKSLAKLYSLDVDERIVILRTNPSRARPPVGQWCLSNRGKPVRAVAVCSYNPKKSRLHGGICAGRDTPTSQLPVPWSPRP
jgi:hypothetical protein